MHHNFEKSKKEVVVNALRPFGTTIFTEMNILAQTHKAVNLSQGSPDFEGPVEIKEKAAQAILRGPNQYITSTGISLLRKAVSNKMERFYGKKVDEDLEITVTSGATEGLCATLLGIIEPGDEVILLEPFYDSYPPVLAMAGAKTRYISLKGDDFSLPLKELEEEFNSKTRAIIINNPHNPTGKVFTKDELTHIGRLCKKFDAYAIGDEVYEHIVYDKKKHITLFDIPELKDRAFVISSTGKTFSMTGWKIGYVIASPELSKAVRMTHQFITFCGQSALQEAMAFGINMPDTYYTNLLSDYTRRRDWLCEALINAGFTIHPPEGAYYVLADIRSMGFDDDLDFCKILTKDAGVAAIPCSFFWHQRKQGKNLVRFCFCKQDETLKKGVERLKKWAK